MNEGWNVILRYDEDFNRLRMWIISRTGHETTVVNPINLELTTTMEPHTVLPEPTIQFNENDSHQFLQGLADGLANAGFLPDKLKAKDSELVAVRYHLEDMRLLVMQALLPPEIPPKYLKES